MMKNRQARSCEDCHKSHKSVDIRQSDLLLCDNCETVRQHDQLIRKKQTSSGPWSVTPTRPVTKTPTGSNIPSSDTVPKQTTNVASPDQTAQDLCPGLSCSTRAGDTTVSCFICQNHYHLPCVQLTRRPSKSSNWCCSQCKDVPSLFRELKNNISVLSAWQETMYSQQQDLKAENSALKEQVKELVQLLNKQPLPSQANKVDEACPSTVPGNSDWSDIPLTESENADVDTPWSTVTRRRKRSALKRTLNSAFRYDSPESRDPGKKRSHEQNRSKDNKMRTTRYDHRESRNQMYHRPMQKSKYDSFPRSEYHGYANTRHRQQRSRNFDRDIHEHTRETRHYARQEKRGWDRRECFNCGLTNHASNECHFKYPVTCRTCGEIGHKSRWHKDNNDLIYRN